MPTLREKTRSDFPEHFEVTDNLIRQIEQELSALDSGSMFSLPDVVIMPLFLKAFETFRAGMLLLLEGYARDVLTLSRTLFEILVTLEYMEKDISVRSESFARYYFERIEEYLKRLREYSPESRLITPEFKTQKSPSWGKVSIRSRSLAVNRLREYELTYFMLSEVTHSGAVGFNYYVQQRTDVRGTKHFVLNVEPREAGTADAIHYLVHFFSYITFAASRTILPRLTELVENTKPRLVGELFMEQIKVRLSRILQMELPNQHFVIAADHLSRSITVLWVDGGRELNFSLKGANEAFVEPDVLLGIAFQVYQRIVQTWRLPNPGTKNINSYVF